MGTSVDRRDCTSIKIQILRTLYLKGQVGIYSGQLGGLAHEICTNPRTFSRAIRDLERSGLIMLDEVALDQKRVRVARITESGRQQVAASYQLLAKL